MQETKPFEISKQVVIIAYEKVKANKGTYGVDEQSIEDFEIELKNNLYKVWNRMSSGTPQGGVISPVLANLFLHYTFDDFMVKEFPTISWERYADDGVTHCTSLKQVKYLQRRLEERFKQCGLEFNMIRGSKRS